MGDISKSDVVYIDELLKDLIPGFLENRAKDFVTMERILFNQDFDGMTKLGHRLTGEGYNYGFEKLGQLASFLEAAGKEKNLEKATETVQQIRQHVQNVQVNFVPSPD